ncbi:DUF4127 family protein [Paenibacillus arenilitoris]|uniref:DUF4127 family protein n=1 Tax=Paenibacillus arenilitoris TaxID=2772299 RepID=A0A927CMU7_9BACL|nr:DUF4127 family protein [Paenibacillus arenilitoris]MBD2870177.1 DUF4127 family protein [Paenibacillus arenilitoris]
MSKIVYLPLDERPCNAKYPKMIAAITDLALVAPPAALLGAKKRPAAFEGLARWLSAEAERADYLIVSADMLVYGGIVPSRLHQLPYAECAARLSVLKELKRRNPALRIYAFSLIMRAPAYDSSDEEPDYYEHYGQAICRYGWLEDKQAAAPPGEEERLERERLLARIPQEVLGDFLRRRATNARINELAIEFVKEGVIDQLIIPLDDNAEYGFSPMEQRNLLFAVERGNLMDRVLIHPGADEVGCILFAKVFCEVKQYQPEACVRYSSTRGPAIIPKYEDRSLNESVKSHLNAGGAFMGDSAHTADFVLMVHSPPVSQQDVAESPNPFARRHRAYYSEVHTAEFVTALDALSRRGHLVALADVASCNGADHALMQLLAKKNLLRRLTAYAGWNTSGNTLGTVVSHAIVASYYRRSPSRPAHSDAMSDRFRLYRFIEDWGYQTLARQQIAAHLPELGGNYFQIGHIRERVSQLVTDKLRRFCTDFLGEAAGGAADGLSADLPWNRMFEVDLTLGQDGPVRDGR